MRLGRAIVVLSLLVAGPAGAQNAFTTFGLSGTWSNDCAARGGSKAKPLIRTTYDGATVRTLISFAPDGGMETTSQVKDSSLVGDDKIKFEMIDLTRTVGGKPAFPDRGRQTMTYVTMQKVNGKIRTIASNTVPPQEVMIKDGRTFAAVGAPPPPGAMPTYRDTGVVSPFMEKCAN